MNPMREELKLRCAYCGQVDCQHQRNTHQHIREIYANAEVLKGEGTPPRAGGQVFSNEAGLAEMLCRWTKHKITIRWNDFRTLSCACGAWLKQVVEEDDGIISKVTVDALRAEIQQGYRENADLRAKIQYLIDQIGWSEEGCFTFPDGDTWWKEPTE